MTFRTEHLAEVLRSRIVETPTGCWIWTGHKDGKGYGRLNVKGLSKRAHRATYETLVGPIPDGLQLDHLCRVRACCNPAHLEPVTPAENVRRGDVGKINRSKTHCPHGHEYNDANTLVSRGRRYCKACLAANYKERWASADWRERRLQYFREYRAKRRAEASL